MDWTTAKWDDLQLLDIALLRYCHMQPKNSQIAKHARRLAHEVEEELRKIADGKRAD